MKQIAQNYRSGELSVVEVPAPACSPGGVLVRSVYSLISTGTEVMKVKEAKLSLAARLGLDPSRFDRWSTRSPSRARSPLTRRS